MDFWKLSIYRFSVEIGFKRERKRNAETHFWGLSVFLYFIHLIFFIFVENKFIQNAKFQFIRGMSSSPAQHQRKRVGYFLDKTSKIIERALLGQCCKLWDVAVWANGSTHITRKVTATSWGTCANIPPFSHYTRALEMPEKRSQKSR